MNKINLLKNRYVIITALFAVWILFFDSSSVREWTAQMSDNKALRERIDEIDESAVELAKQTKALRTNNDSLEKYVREKYMMKKEGEEIFVIEK